MSFRNLVKNNVCLIMSMLSGVMLAPLTIASEASLPKEVDELKPRCDQVMRDIRDEKVDDMEGRCLE
jgi:hypothetical protein